MAGVLSIKPIINELPSHYADRVGQIYAGTVSTQHKKDKGQFFTPTEIAGSWQDLQNKIRIN